MTEPRGLTSVEQIGLAERMLRVFHAPRRTFEAIASGGSFPDWVAPVALVVLFWAAHNLAVMSIVAPEIPATMEGWEQFTEEQRQSATKGLKVWRSHGWISFPLVNSFSSLALVGLVLLGLCRWVLRVQVTLSQMLTVKAYASLVTIPQWILLTPLVRTGDAGASPLSFTPGALMADPFASPLGRFLSSLNLFDLWEVGVIGVGLSVMTALTTRRTTGILLVLWLAWIVMQMLAPSSTEQVPPVSYVPSD